MSNLADQAEQTCDVSDTSALVELLIKPRDRDLGGFSVRRVLPTAQKRMVGPWIFFDHMGPVTFAAGKGVNVRPHPHINLATVTYLFEGEILHRDSLGNEQPIQPGDINLMVAGRGIVHSERERVEHRATEHRLNGLQLWLALPEADEETDPAFYHYDANDIPRAEPGGVPVRVMMGSAWGASSPVTTFADTLYLEARLDSGQQLTLPQAAERAVYVVDGELAIGNTTVPEHAMAVVATGDVTLEAKRQSRLVVIGGEPLGQRFIEWNFVSSRAERIEQAKSDWREHRFPDVPGDTEEFIPLPGE